MEKQPWALDKNFSWLDRLEQPLKTVKLQCKESLIDPFFTKKSFPALHLRFGPHPHREVTFSADYPVQRISSTNNQAFLNTNIIDIEFLANVQSLTQLSIKSMPDFCSGKNNHQSQWPWKEWVISICSNIGVIFTETSRHISVCHGWVAELLHWFLV